MQATLGDVDVVLFVVEAGRFSLDDAKVLALLPEDKPVLLIANKLDAVRRRAELAPWLQAMAERRAFAEFVPLSANRPSDTQRCSASSSPTCPSSPGSTTSTRSPTATSASSPARSSARSCSA